MLFGLVIALVDLGTLACPLMMLLGRRGIGPSCALSTCRDAADSIRARQSELSEQIVDRLCMSFRAAGISGTTTRSMEPSELSVL